MSTPDLSLERKERNEQFLKTLGVPVNPNLLRVESETEAGLREPKEVAKRAVALYALISVAHQADPEGAVSWLNDEDLWEAVTPKEKVFLGRKTHPRKRSLTRRGVQSLCGRCFGRSER